MIDDGSFTNWNVYDLFLADLAYH